ncbi:MAG: nuclear transport factor 2 family protein [Solirubrobacterales bacterium]
MSQAENVELVRGSFGLMSIPGDPEPMIAAIAPGFELNLVGVGGMPVHYTGASGIREFFRDVEESWEFFRFEGSDFRDLGDRVLILGDVTGRGRVSGADVKAQWACIVELEGRKATSVQGFLDHAEALAAAGLEE